MLVAKWVMSTLLLKDLPLHSQKLLIQPCELGDWPSLSVPWDPVHLFSSNPEPFCGLCRHPAPHTQAVEDGPAPLPASLLLW